MSVVADASEERSAPSREPPRKRRRPLLRFRLRTLFVAAVLMSLLLGWYGRHVYRVRQERAAAERLRQAGAHLTMPTFEYAGTELPTDLYGLLPWFHVEEHTFVALDSRHGAGDADMQHLGGLRGLRSLTLTGETFSDEGLRSVGDAKSIAEFYFRHTSITGDGLARYDGRERLTILRFDTAPSAKPARVLERIDSLPNLASLMTVGEPLTVEGMRAVASLQHLRNFQSNDAPTTELEAFDELARAPILEELNIQMFMPPPIGDRELAAICEIETLRTLALPAPQLTDAGFERLAELPQLRQLYVINCRNVTDAGVATLADIETLEEVSLSSCSLSDESLDTLRRLPNLRKAFLPSGISREAAQRFANERPGCEVWLDEPGSPSVRITPDASDKQTGTNEAAPTR